MVKKQDIFFKYGDILPNNTKRKMTQYKIPRIISKRILMRHEEERILHREQRINNIAWKLWREKNREDFNISDLKVPKDKQKKIRDESEKTKLKIHEIRLRLEDRITNSQDLKVFKEFANNNKISFEYDNHYRYRKDITFTGPIKKEKSTEELSLTLRYSKEKIYRLGTIEKINPEKLVPTFEIHIKNNSTNWHSDRANILFSLNNEPKIFSNPFPNKKPVMDIRPSQVSSQTYLKRREEYMEECRQIDLERLKLLKETSKISYQMYNRLQEVYAKL